MATRLTLLSFSLIISSLVSAQQLPQTSRFDGIDTLLEKLLDDYQVAGFSVAVVHNDSVIYSQGFGYRDYENKRPVTPNTLFAIGSCTKAFTAALLGQLADEDKLSLDGNAQAYLPELQFYDKDMNAATVRDLMTHRTGLDRYDFSWYNFNSDSRDSLLARIQYMEPTAALREKWQYNNFMYLAQGMIAEHITGKSWEENIKSRFFEPLGMHRSNMEILDLEKETDAAFGYGVGEDKGIKKLPYFRIRGMGPAGSINSSALEMTNWLRLWLKGGQYQGKEMLSRNYVGDAASSQIVVQPGLPGEHRDIHLANYGLGWFISSYRGHYQVEHGGNIDGFSASTCFYPYHDLGIVVLSNQNTSAVPRIVRNFIADRFLELPFVDWNERGGQKKEADTAEDTTKLKDIGRIPNTTPSHQLRDYTGNYENPAYGKFEIILNNDTLTTQMGAKHYRLQHYHFDVFEVKELEGNGTAGVNVNFRTAVDGSIESMIIPFDPTSDPVEFKRQANAVELPADELDNYVGEYELANMRIKVSVKDGVLYMFVPGQQNYETTALGDHKFNLKALKGFSIKFEVSENGTVEALNSIQPNGTFRAVRVQ